MCAEYNGKNLILVRWNVNMCATGVVQVMQSNDRKITALSEGNCERDWEPFYALAVNGGHRIGLSVRWGDRGNATYINDFDVLRLCKK